MIKLINIENHLNHQSLHDWYVNLDNIYLLTDL